MIASIGYLVAAVIAITAGIGAYFISRRVNSGKVSTTEATVLWQQSQAIREMMQAEKDKAEQQRDKLIDAYTNSMIPTLKEINDGIKAIHGLLKINQGQERRPRS